MNPHPWPLSRPGRGEKSPDPGRFAETPPSPQSGEGPRVRLRRAYRPSLESPHGPSPPPHRQRQRAPARLDQRRRAGAPPGVGRDRRRLAGARLRGAASAEAVFAEHFLEHLAVDDALGFLLEVHRVLVRRRLGAPLDPQPRLGLADPLPAGGGAGGEAGGGARHQPRLPGVAPPVPLEPRDPGGGARRHRLRRGPLVPAGESELPLFRGLERHDTYGDTDDLPHILIAEARKGCHREPERAGRTLRKAVQHGFRTRMDSDSGD